MLSQYWLFCTDFPSCATWPSTRQGQVFSHTQEIFFNYSFSYLLFHGFGFPFLGYTEVGSSLPNFFITSLDYFHSIFLFASLSTPTSLHLVRIPEWTFRGVYSFLCSCLYNFHLWNISILFSNSFLSPVNSLFTFFNWLVTLFLSF